jgi:hypothetical protein
MTLNIDQVPHGDVKSLRAMMLDLRMIRGGYDGRMRDLRSMKFHDAICKGAQKHLEGEG